MATGGQAQHERTPTSVSRRGTTLLEAVFAVVLLAMVAAAVTSAISFVSSSDVRNQRRLGAYEIANRLILQHLDDDDQMPNPSLPLDYDRYRYMYEIDVERVRMQQPRLSDTARDPVPQAMERFREVTVTVYSIDPRSPETLPVKAERLASLTRLYDRYAGRNFDSLERLTQEDIMGWIEELTGQRVPAGSTPNGSQPPVDLPTLPDGGGRDRR